ncbi:hypothetical protein U6A24_13845 [Aquimarina gracilis]|uniref:Type IX secretion system PorP/SprF family membrane protein n=1 Tax=Aquimarina gracilis TaxID=874422 RepID=A0ABU5ZXG1_9FLAO|nr:hypothetical protein [Aquimarina gracilis]MEB3346556.1 hypothetical protein [Aquimarina gracilis]
MRERNLSPYYFIVIFLSYCTTYSQQINIDGGILLNAQITLGNQNQWLKLGAFGFGAINYGDISLESGISFATYQFLKRHTVKTSGLAYSYEFFALGGIGKNTNLLGASVSNMNTSIIYNPSGQGGFNGLGFGFSKDVLPKSLKSYGLKRGALYMRFSNSNHNIHLSFLNDFKIGWFKGSGTDYGVTGSLNIGFTKIHDPITIYQLGLGIDLFTPRPNYSLSPRNPINSDDGRKNVWFTLPPFEDLFYGNLYGYGTYQEDYYSVHLKLGTNSQKAGAYIQNKLHDGLGLNPRFPWQVETKDKLYIEITGDAFLKEVSND